MDDRGERRLAWALLAMGLSAMSMMFALASMGLVKGLESGHPLPYLQGTYVAGAIVLSLIPVLRLLGLASVPPWLTALLYGDIYYYVLSLSHGMYLDISWWGDLAHIITSGIVGCIVFMGLCAVHVKSPPHVSLGSNGGIAALTLLLGIAFGGVWEIMEGYTDIIVGAPYMSYSATDTLCDLAADLAGTAGAATLGWLILRRAGPEGALAGLRIGKREVGK